MRAQVWDPQVLGRVSPSMQKFYETSITFFLEEALIEAISKIVRINRSGVQSLANDIEALSKSGIAELGSVSRVKKYIKLLSHQDDAEDDDGFFSAIAEDTGLKLKFS